MIIKGPVAIIADPISFTFVDYPEPTATAMVVYFVGCEHNCAGCQNPMLQSESLNSNMCKIYTIKELFNELLKLSSKYRTFNVVFSGGDPLYKKHITFVKQFLEFNSFNNNKFSICIFTGYDENYVKQQGIDKFNYLKTGIYIEMLKQQSIKTDTIYQLASKNQKLFDENFNLLTNPIGVYYFNK